jgi:tetratricopeptide (TPR) repeat protein
MKVVHKNKDLQTEGDWITRATDLEKNGELDRAADAWLRVLKAHSLYVPAYDRLMIIYRKQKEYHKELKMINKAISVFKERFEKKKPAYNKKITALSKALLKATGLGDKKGGSLYQLGELARWNKRKKLLQNRLSAGKK